MKVTASDRQVEEHEILRHWNLTERYPIWLTGKPTWLWTFADDHGTYLEKAGNIFSDYLGTPKNYCFNYSDWSESEDDLLHLKSKWVKLTREESDLSKKFKMEDGTEYGSLQKTILSNSGLSYKRQKEVLLLYTLKKILIHLKQIWKQSKVLVSKLKSTKMLKSLREISQKTLIILPD